MGFGQRLILVLISCLMFGSGTVKAQDGNNYLSIPDFTLHRVTPQKTVDSNTEKEKQPVNKNTDTVALPKLRLISKPEKINQNIINKTNKDVKTIKNSPPKTVPVPKIIQNQPEAIEKKVYEVGQKPDNNSDELVSKINKINEKNQDVQKNGLKTNNIAKEAKNDFFSMFYSLGIVLFLILLLGWIYAKLKGINPAAILTGNFAEKDLNKLNILSTSTLGQGKDIHLVEINGKQLVIGSTTNNISLLTEIPAEEVEKLKEQRHKNHNKDSYDDDGHHQENIAVEEVDEDIVVDEVEQYPDSKEFSDVLENEEIKQNEELDVINDFEVNDDIDILSDKQDIDDIDEIEIVEDKVEDTKNENIKETASFDNSEDYDEIEFTEDSFYKEEDLYYDSDDEIELKDADFYSSRYSQVYKEYLKKKD